jgi:DNA-binding transcriptional regulator YdaS (Cro superfamily)
MPMDAKTYFTERDMKVARDGAELCRVAEVCEITPGTLYLIALGHKPASPKLAALIEYATDGAIDRRETLPDFPWDAPPTSEAA